MANEAVGTTNIWPYYSAQNVQKAARTPTKELGKDEFLQILIAQLRNQDPMQPLEDKEFISQMAQFSSLEQTANMASELKSLRQSAGIASGIIGMQVSWIATSNTGTVEAKNGIVDSIVMRDGIQYAKIGQSEVKIDELTSIALPSVSGGSGSGVAASE
ncbi:flagellar hook capping FlgD N-terminal domain-containing protein [Cohnella faecalis]|uniref:Flagellar hook capping protein n=1 Tax=Cohnella faecalis TaxID=2315694 RepID=A0A398CR70_9BACL|nr:flagellar hook capping FlgD N-terminal domain-containing protein [Cohnella faecalis]RIE03288.1 flagellar hook capping protein [Cohnella faecalis]